jgi:hypothetical protein
MTCRITTFDPVYLLPEMVDFPQAGFLRQTVRGTPALILRDSASQDMVQDLKTRRNPRPDWTDSS